MGPQSEPAAGPLHTEEAEMVDAAVCRAAPSKSADTIGERGDHICARGQDQESASGQRDGWHGHVVRNEKKKENTVVTRGAEARPTRLGRPGRDS